MTLKRLRWRLVPKPDRALIRVLCALLALTLALAGFAPPDAPVRLEKKTCCCGSETPRPCCARNLSCCAREQDRRAPDRAAPSGSNVELHLALVDSPSKTSERPRLAVETSEAGFSASPAHARRHLLLSVFRT
jgi:hypothetical protein